MIEREEHTRQIGIGGAGGVLLKVIGAVGFVGGLALIVAGIVNIVHLHDRAGGTAGIVMGFVFVLMGKYLWRVPGRPVVELTDDGIIFHADLDPFMMLFTRMRRTVTYRWEHIEAIDVRPTRFAGMTIWVYLDVGPEHGRRMMPVPYVSPDAAGFVAEMRRLSARARRDKPTEWGSGGHLASSRRAFQRKAFFAIVAAWVVVIAVFKLTE
jgi:hypothetical protein